jgi:hypothetical protein
VVIWYTFPRFGILYQEKSGNPAGNAFWFRKQKAWLFSSSSEESIEKENEFSEVRSRKKTFVLLANLQSGPIKVCPSMPTHINMF